ncbi:hypothetical protein NLJ89_g1835 [Agrocybe chaxingu]|uniref:SET domain-containing protein n=1 Tax=Agrocybe chaxingu TaxID=84603 RepID=A0A9W8TCS9_9AGAR|nr:hypothetical protein NLJ89_g1835 [Agrocybe chaxingu]
MKRGFLNSSKVKKQRLYAQNESKPASTEYFKDIEGLPKLAYGRVEDTSLPSDYDASWKPESMSSDASKTHYGEEVVGTTTIPPRFLDGPPDPDGHSEWLFWGPTKVKVVGLPGYPRPIPKPTHPNMCVVRSTPDKGLGVFATRDIKVGELIFSERPLLVVPTGIRAMSPIPKHYSQEKKLQIAMFQQEKSVEPAVDRMDEAQKKAFMALANSHKEDGSGPLYGIIRTNGIGLGNLGDGPKPPAGQYYPPQFMYTAICELGSRINHSCMPNVKFSFKLSSFSLQSSASKDIKAGEELFYSYCPVLQTAADRRKDLAPYGFECKCPACLHATPATDKLRAEFLDRIRRVVQAWSEKCKSPVHDITMLDPLLELQKDVTREGLDSQGQYPFLTEVIATAYMSLGMVGQAQRYQEVKHRWDSMAKDED